MSTTQLRGRRPAQDRLLRIIQAEGFITGRDLEARSGITQGNLFERLHPAIAQGLVSVEVAQDADRRGKKPRLYRWQGKPGPVKAGAGPIDPQRAALRGCLSCGSQFRSSSAANRICPACAKGNARSSCGRFDEAVTVRYR